MMLQFSDHNVWIDVVICWDKFPSKIWRGAQKLRKWFGNGETLFRIDLKSDGDSSNIA
jgi:hypothetical protein